MTPVEATSTCSGGQPTSARRLGRHLARVGHARVAGARVGAAAVDDDRARDAAGSAQVIRDTSTGAACTLFSVKTAAAVAGVSDTSNARSSGPAACVAPRPDGCRFV